MADGRCILTNLMGFIFQNNCNLKINVLKFRLFQIPYYSRLAVQQIGEFRMHYTGIKMTKVKYFLTSSVKIISSGIFALSFAFNTRILSIT